MMILRIYVYKVKFYIRYIFLLFFVVNIFSQEKLNAHNKVNGGCEPHCLRKEFKFNYTNSKKYKNIKFENNKNFKSCLNSNLCRG